MAHQDGGAGVDKSLGRTFTLIREGPLFGLFVVLGLEVLGGASTIPVFSFFCIHELGLGATSVGTLVSAFNLAQSLGGPLFGRVSDAFGRKVILLLCFAWSSSCFVATSMVRGFWDLLIVRTLAGLSGGSIPVAAAMVMDSAGPADRPGILGAKGAVLGTTFTFGPLMMVVLLEHGVSRRFVFLVAGSFCFAGFLVGLVLLRESLPAEKRRPLCRQRRGGCCHGLIEDYHLTNMGLVLAWFSRFFYAFSTFCLYATYSFLIKDNFGWSDREFGIILSICGISQGFLEMLLYPATSSAIGKHWVVALGFLFMVSSHCVFPSRRLSFHIFALVLFNMGQALCDPGLINLTGFYAPSERHMGFAQGVSNGFRAMASVVGPFFAGRLYDVFPMWTFGLASGVAAAGFCSVTLAAWLCETEALSETAQEKRRLLEQESPLSQSQLEDIRW